MSRLNNIARPSLICSDHENMSNNLALKQFVRTNVRKPSDLFSFAFTTFQNIKEIQFALMDEFRVNIDVS